MCNFFRIGWFVDQARERESPTMNKNNNKRNAKALKVTANPAEIADEPLQSGGCAAHRFSLGAFEMIESTNQVSAIFCNIFPTFHGHVFAMNPQF